MSENGLEIHGLWVNLGVNNTFCTGYDSCIEFEGENGEKHLFTIPLSHLTGGLWKKCVDPDWANDNKLGMCSKSYRNSQWDVVTITE